MTTAGRRVLVGRIVGLYGVQGWLKIESWTEPRLRIFNYQPWLISSRLASDKVAALSKFDGVTGHAQGKGIVAALPGIHDRDKAKALVGSEIFVDREQLPAPDEGEYYWVDLEGLEVFTTTEVALGRVSHLFATGANDVIVVKDGERERLVPFVQGVYVHSVDLSGGRMVVDWDPDF